MDEQELIEKLAHFEHESWNRWMRWLYQNGTWNNDGSFTISADKATRWDRLSLMEYSSLDEPTKQYDRDEVAHILPLIDSKAREARAEVVRRVRKSNYYPGDMAGLINSGPRCFIVENELDRIERESAPLTIFGVKVEIDDSLPDNVVHIRRDKGDDL